MELASAFIEQTSSLLGKEEYQKLIKALALESSTSFRLNSRKIQKYNNFPETDVDLSSVSWATNAYYTQDRLTFTFDPLFHSGAYYVQEASSMFLEQVVKQHISSPVVMLDLCAAPGGKSTHAISCLPEGSLLVANEVIRTRSSILAENLIKWGNPNVVVTNNDPSDFSNLSECFDVILTDVPCSGEGMFRKDPTAIKEWSPENVKLCQQRQRRIITDIWNSLKTEGILIYSTCTYNTKENEENIEWICQELDGKVLEVNLPENTGITGNLLNKDFPVYRFFPHKTKGEGFFLAVIQKTGQQENSLSSMKDKRNKKNKDSKSRIKLSTEQFEKWLIDPNEYFLETSETTITAIPQSHEAIYHKLKSLKIIQAGIRLGEIKGKDLIPHHSLAMSNALNMSAFDCKEINYEQAIAYLRKEAITLDNETPRGYILLTYKNIPLGFVKNIGNRANNLYPNEWRIRSSYNPEIVRELSTILNF